MSDDSDWSEEKMQKHYKETKKAWQKWSNEVTNKATKAKSGFEDDADQFVSQKVRGILSGSIPVPISYEDSDQSPVSYLAGQFVMNLWEMSMDYVPFEPMYHYLSDWLKTIWRGDYQGFLKLIKDKNPNELDMMLKKRESLLNYSAIFHVIIGARSVGAGNLTPRPMLHRINSMLDVKNEHMKILIKLLSLGVDVNVHDFAGFTPFHHCFTSFGTELTLKMGEKLLRAGAKIDDPNRLGVTPLMTLSMTTRYEAISFLLENGADPYKKDNHGLTPHGISKFNPKTQGLIVKFYKKNMKEKMKDPDYKSQSLCVNCKDEKKDTKKCAGCYSAWYCSLSCQKEDWSQHANECKKAKSRYKIAKYPSLKFSHIWDANSGPTIVVPPKESKKPMKTQFDVQVQVPLHGGMIGGKINKKGDLSVHNKDQTFSVSLPRKENEDLHKKLVKKITTEGFKGLKGYFHVILEPGDKEANRFRINPDNIFTEPW